MTGRKGGQSASILNRSTVNCVKDGLRTSTVSVYAGDLASESGRNISKKLSKVRRKERNARNLPVGVAQNVGPEQEVGICGAPSVVDRDTQDEILAEKDESDWEDIEEHGNGRFGINPGASSRFFDFEASKGAQFLGGLRVTVEVQFSYDVRV